MPSEIPISLFYQAEVRTFLHAHATEDPVILALKYSGKTSFLLPPVLEQIRLRQKSLLKLPGWADRNCLFTERALEQCSSALTAEWKKDQLATFIQNARVLDCNTGLGVDSIALSDVSREIHTLEKDPELAALFEYNQKQLGKNIQVQQAEVLSWLEKNPGENFDLVYADPDRRNASGEKVSDPNACDPPVNLLLEILEKRTKYILLKMSPLFDPNEGVRVFPGVKEVWIISVKHECREILFLIQPGYTGDVLYRTGAWFREKWFSYCGRPDFREFRAETTGPWVYLPDVANLLSGLIPENVHINGILERGRIVFSSELMPDFPGTPYRLIHTFDSCGKSMMRTLLELVPGPYLNISAKGSRLRPSELLKKLHKKEGGEYLLVIGKNQDSAWLLENASR